MKSPPLQIDLFDPPPEFGHMDPNSLELPSCPTEPVVGQRLLDSVRRLGVVSPVIVAQGPDGTRSLVAGRRRVMAAAQTGQLVPVRAVTGTSVELQIQAFNEDFHKRTRSGVERGWQVERIKAAAKANGVKVSRRWLAKHLGVCVGTAHNWMTLGERLPEARVAQLAEAAGMEATRIVALPIRQAMRVAHAADDADAVMLVQQLLSNKPQHTKRFDIWSCLRALIIALAASLRRAVSRIKSMMVPEKREGEPPI